MGYQPKSYRKFLAATASTAVAVTGIASAVVPAAASAASITSVQYPKDFTVNYGQAPSNSQLPSKVKVTYSNHTTGYVSVHWSAVNTHKVGKSTVVGTIAGTVHHAYVHVTVNAPKVVAPTITQVMYPADVTVNVGDTVNLPSQVTVVYSNGTTGKVNVSWAPVNTTQTGKLPTVVGTVAGTVHKAYVHVTVVDPGTIVKSVSAINASQLQITFSKPVLASDLIDSTNPSAPVLKNVTITPGTQSDGVTASTNPGTLTPSLSADGKTLTLTTAAGNEFKGSYEVSVAKNEVETVADGSYVAAYDGTVVANDTTRPTVTGVTYSPDGKTAYVAFSEPVTTLDQDFAVTSVKRTDGVALDATSTLGTASVKNDATNRNVLDVDLSGLALADQSKNIQLSFVGVKDEAGNLVNPNPSTVTVNYNTTQQSQASIVSVKRTALDTLELTFNKALKTAPSVTINSDTPATGQVSSTDPTVYDVTLTSDEAKLTGLQNVSVNGFDAYNTAGAVTTPVKKIVDFTIDTTTPKVTSTQLVTLNNKNYLVVNFNKAVTLSSLAGGNLTGTVSEPNGDLVAIPQVDFASGDVSFYNQPLNATTSNSIKIDLTNLKKDTDSSAYTLVPGTYNVTLSSGVASDAFGNASAQATNTSFTISTSTANLPAPTVASKDGNPSIVEVTFPDKVDATSAQNVANYSIEGATVTAAKLVSNSTAGGAVVDLSIAPGTMSFTGAHQVNINNVAGYANSYAPMLPYSAIVSFNENVAPTLVSTNPVTLTSTTSIEVDFNTTLVDPDTATPVPNEFDVYQNGVKVAVASEVVSGSSVVINLSSPVTSTSGLVVEPASTLDLTDSLGNAVAFSATPVTVAN